MRCDRWCRWIIVILIGVFVGVLPAVAQDDDVDIISPVDKCINLGNMLEAPREGDWGLTVEDAYLTVIADAGFDTVRIPIRWSAHAGDSAPYMIDAEFMARVTHVVDTALDAGLQVIVNIHHYEEMMTDPDAEFERYLGLWEQIATTFMDYPDTLMFELLNEPNNKLNAVIWNDFYPDAIEVIREMNPTRQIIVGGDEWNNASALARLILPEDRENLIATFHFYDPFEFTHQGAEWAIDIGSNEWLGTEFGMDADFVLVNSVFDDVLDWQNANQIPVLLGEFGAYSKADMASRLLYTETVRQAAVSRGFGWCYWEFAAGFGIYNPNTERFNELYLALIPDDE
ncbi:MAG: glycoside hydrolase family 5 protein [Aggregatilineales bacterium]